MSKLILPPNYTKRIQKAKNELLKPKRIVFCCPGNHFSEYWVSCFGRTLIDLYDRGYSLRTKIAYHPNVYDARNWLLINFPSGLKKDKKDIPWNGDLDYDYIMWIDSDMVWEPEHILTLLRYDKDIVTGVTMLANNTCNMVALDDDEYDMMSYSLIKGKGLTEVRACGFAFVLVKRGVFEKVKYPWFRPVYFYNKELEMDKPVSEDIGFCMLAKEAGYKIYVDPDVVLGHEKRVMLGGKYEQPTW